MILLNLAMETKVQNLLEKLESYLSLLEVGDYSFS